MPHARCVGLIETCEESGSYDLPAYLELLAPRMGAVDFVVGLDSGCGDYERLWATTSLRGLAGGTLTVDVLTEGVHSGDASGIVPSSFRIARGLLDRLEDSATGRVLPPEFHAPIPDERVRQAKMAAAIMGEATVRKYPFAAQTKPMQSDHADALLNRTWRPALSVTGADGFPAIADAGNVLRPRTSLKLSLRLPPPVDGALAMQTMRRLLEADPPHGASVRFEGDEGATGWNAPPTAPWLARALDDASNAFYGKPSAAMGEGGTIPFMAMLGKHFPAAQFLITGVLGPKSNAHGPNEFLHVPYATKLTACVATVLAAHAARAGLGVGVGSAGERQHVVLPARERADQQARDVGIEHRARRRLDEAAELAFVLRGAEPAPVADHVQIGAISEQRPLPDRREPGKGPGRYRVPRQRDSDALVVHRGGFGAHARARASLHLAREAGTQALLQPQRFPAQRVLGRERRGAFRGPVGATRTARTGRPALPVPRLRPE